MPRKDRSTATAQRVGDKPLSLDARELISPQDRLQFAKWLLRGIFCSFLISILIWLYQESYGKSLLELCKTALLPIAVFIIGDYFGSKK